MPKEIKDIKVFMEMLIPGKDIAKGKTAESKVPEKTFKKTLIVK